MIAIGTSLHIPRASRVQLLLWLYLAVVGVAELVTAAVHPQSGLIVHVLLLVALFAHSALTRDSAHHRLALALTLAPLIRILSLALPLVRFPQAAWYPLVSIPLLVATYVIVRQTGVTRHDLGLRRGNVPVQIMLAGFGLGLGALEYLILQPRPLVESLEWTQVWVPVLSLVIFTGFTEEIIFRGLLQSLAGPALGRHDLLYVALLFAVLHIGYLSVEDVLFVFAVGLLFAYIVRWGGSILGVTLAHGTTNVTLFVVMPRVVADRSAGASELIWIVWISLVAGLAAIVVIGLNAWLARQAPPPQNSRAGALRAARRRCGLTYADLAARTGLTVRAICAFEHHLHELAPEQHARMAVAIEAALDLSEHDATDAREPSASIRFEPAQLAG